MTGYPSVVGRALPAALTVSVVATALVACDDAAVLACDPGQRVETRGRVYCVYPPEVASMLPGSFRCPDLVPSDLDVGGGLVCSERPESPSALPPDVCAALGTCGPSMVADAGLDAARPDDGGAPMDARPRDARMVDASSDVNRIDDAGRADLGTDAGTDAGVVSLLEEHFDGPSLGRPWEIVWGDWSIVAGRLRAGSAAGIAYEVPFDVGDGAFTLDYRIGHTAGAEFSFAWLNVGAIAAIDGTGWTDLAPLVRAHLDTYRSTPGDLDGFVLDRVSSDGSIRDLQRTGTRDLSTSDMLHVHVELCVDRWVVQVDDSERGMVLDWSGTEDVAPPADGGVVYLQFRASGVVPTTGGSGIEIDDVELRRGCP